MARVKRNLARVSRWPIRSLSIGKLYEAYKDEKTIHARALRLLRSWLSPQQRADFDRKGYFDVVGCDTGKRYRIRRGTSANVNEIDEYGRLGTGRCFVPLGGLAQGDVMLAQKIALETDENHALSIANSFPGPLGWRLPRRRPAEARSSGVRLSPAKIRATVLFMRRRHSGLFDCNHNLGGCRVLRDLSGTTDGMYCLIDFGVLP